MIIGFTVIKVVEKNISSAFNRAQIGGWLNAVFDSRYNDSQELVLLEVITG